MRFPRSAAAAMLAFGVFAFLWAVARAWVQDVTGDEGENYVVFVAPHSDQIWNFSATNHLLNSLLMRAVTGVFGPAPLAVRAPALLGAAIYISVTFWLCGLIAERWEVRAPLFVCFVYNPFVFDYFVAARGYGLAAAFLLLAITLHAWAHAEPEERRDRLIPRVLALSSVCLVLSLSANFSFAFVDVATGVALLVWAAVDSRQSRWRLVVWSVVPAVVVFVLLPAWTILHAQRESLYYGAKSLSGMLRSLTFSSLFELNPDVVNPAVYATLNAIKPYMVRALMLAATAALISHMCKGVRQPRTRYLVSLLSVAAGAVIAAILVHLAAHRLIGLPMPQDRTGIYVVVLATLCIGVIASLSAASRAGSITRSALVAMLFIFAFYDLACLRLSYFCQWAYQRDVKDAYNVAAWYANNRGLKDIEVSWYYYGAFSYYRLATGQADAIPRFATGTPHTFNRQSYVVNWALEREFIEGQKLNIVWRSEATHAAVAVR